VREVQWSPVLKVRFYERSGVSCASKLNEESIRMVVALADFITPPDHEFRVVARPRSARGLEGLLASEVTN
jgi:hypothetical protein